MVLLGVNDQRGTLPGDEELLSQAARGVPSALGLLYARHGGELLRLAARLTGSRADAEDLLHDLFVGLPELLGRYEDRGSFAKWLRGVMARMALGRIRLDSRRERMLLQGDPPTLATHRDPAGMMDVDAALARLPDSIRVIFVLRHVEDRNYADIAAMLGISTGSARVRYLRALRQLRDLLEPRP